MDTVVVTPAVLNATGTGWSSGIFTLDPPAGGAISGGGFVNMGGFGAIAGVNYQKSLNNFGTYATTGTQTSGGLSSIYYGTGNLAVNVGPEIHATSTQTLAQNSFERLSFVDSSGSNHTFPTALATSYSLNADKSATWTWTESNVSFNGGIPVAVLFQ